jgi:hypothetical protein
MNDVQRDQIKTILDQLDPSTALKCQRLEKRHGRFIQDQADWIRHRAVLTQEQRNKEDEDGKFVPQNLLDRRGIHQHASFDAKLAEMRRLARDPRAREQQAQQRRQIYNQFDECNIYRGAGQGTRAYTLKGNAPKPHPMVASADSLDSLVKKYKHEPWSRDQKVQQKRWLYQSADI